MRNLPRQHRCDDVPAAGAARRPMMGSVVLECPRCLTIFAVPSTKGVQVGERRWGIRCKCREIIEWDEGELVPVGMWAQPHVAERVKRLNDGVRDPTSGLVYPEAR